MDNLHFPHILYIFGLAKKVTQVLHKNLRKNPNQLFSLFFFFPFISWRLITLQYCSGFCHTLTGISHGFTCIPPPDPPPPTSLSTRSL